MSILPLQTGEPLTEENHKKRLFQHPPVVELRRPPALTQYIQHQRADFPNYPCSNDNNFCPYSKGNSPEFTEFLPQNAVI